MKRIIILLILCLSSLYSGIGQVMPSSSEEDLRWIREQERNYYCQSFGFDVPAVWNKILYDTLENWLGTPYRFAGNTMDGIDCSGFVNAVYANVYKCAVGARNSGDIYKKITKVDKEELTEGDLVFFSIRKKRISHVGVYLGNNKFIHASTSSGVIVSDLQEPYYKKYYAGGGHIPSFTEHGAE